MRNILKNDKYLKNKLKLVKSYFEDKLANYEYYKNEQYRDVRWAPIFILGAPRTGTTLLYQVLCSCLKLSFFCNAALYFPRSVATATGVISRFIEIIPPRRFESFYGETDGWSSPNQGRSVWKRWFPADQSWIDPNSLGFRDLIQLRGTIGRIEEYFQFPFINKSQGNCVRVDSLVKAFPNAMFIVLKRDYKYTIQSILRGKRLLFGDDDCWFSVKPSNFENLSNTSGVEQIAYQIYYLEKDIYNSLSSFENISIFELCYEDFCLNPNIYLHKIVNFYEKNYQYKINLRSYCETSFVVDNSVKLDVNEFREIESIVKNIWQ